MAIATMRIGISCIVRNDKVVAAVAPKIESTANPIGPQEVHIPAPAPTTEPKSPVPIFLVLVPTVLILYVAILITRAISPAVMIINPKLRLESCGR